MVAQRDEKGKFVKGKSGNPGGRPAGEFTISGLIDEAVTKEDWLFIINTLKTKARRGDVKAIEMLMDRRWGKPVQENRNTGEGGGPMRIEVVYADIDS
jgi:hypothetical protein